MRPAHGNSDSGCSSPHPCSDQAPAAVGRTSQNRVGQRTLPPLANQRQVSSRVFQQPHHQVSRPRAQSQSPHTRRCNTDKHCHRWCSSDPATSRSHTDPSAASPRSHSNSKPPPPHHPTRSPTSSNCHLLSATGAVKGNPASPSPDWSPRLWIAAIGLAVRCCRYRARTCTCLGPSSPSPA